MKTASATVLVRSLSNFSRAGEASGASPIRSRAGQKSLTRLRRRASAPSAGLVASTSRHWARKQAAQLATMSAATTTATWADDIFAVVSISAVLLCGPPSKVGLGPAPMQRGGPQCAVETLRPVGAQLQALAVDLHQSHLALTDPVGKEADCHFMGQAAFGLIDEEAPGIGDVTAPRRHILLGAAAKQIPFLEWRARRALQLGGHISIRGIEDEPQRTFAQYVVLDPGLHIALDGADQFPSANQALAQT